MIKVHCAGCGMTEPADRRDKITRVTVEVVSDRREWVAQPKFEEDLCDGCVTRVLRTFFGVRLADDVTPPIALSSVAA